MSPKKITTQKSPGIRCSLMHLPAEVRINILEHLFESYCHGKFSAFFYLYKAICREDRMRPPIIATGITLAILRTCKQIHEEASEVLYGNLNLIVCISPPYIGVPRLQNRLQNSKLRKPESMLFWKFVQKLELRILPEKGRENKRVRLERLGRFLELTIERGRYLRYLKVRLFVDRFDGMSAWLRDVKEKLMILRVSGDVHVLIDGYKRNEMSVELEEIIKRERVLSDHTIQGELPTEVT